MVNGLMVEKRAAKHFSHDRAMFENADAALRFEHDVSALCRVAPLAPLPRGIYPIIPEFSQDGLITSLEVFGKRLERHSPFVEGEQFFAFRVSKIPSKRESAHSNIDGHLS